VRSGGVAARWCRSGRTTAHVLCRADRSHLGLRAGQIEHRPDWAWGELRCCGAPRLEQREWPPCQHRPTRRGAGCPVGPTAVPAPADQPPRAPRRLWTVPLPTEGSGPSPSSPPPASATASAAAGPRLRDWAWPAGPAGCGESLRRLPKRWCCGVRACGRGGAGPGVRAGRCAAWPSCWRGLGRHVTVPGRHSLRSHVLRCAGRRQQQGPSLVGKRGWQHPVDGHFVNPLPPCLSSGRDAFEMLRDQAANGGCRRAPAGCSRPLARLHRTCPCLDVHVDGLYRAASSC
jgi:hypothetical protein